MTQEPELLTEYKTRVLPALREKHGYKNVNQIPKIDKIVINMGLGDCKDNPKALEAAVKELEAIAGQKAITTKAKKSIANFKLREGMNIGAKVTHRGERAVVDLGALPEGVTKVRARAISGAGVASGTKFTQKVTAGTEGVAYLLTCTTTSSSGKVRSLEGFLIIAPPGV